MVNLGVESRTHGSLLCPIRLEKLPNEPRLSITRNNNDITFYATGVNNFDPLFVKSTFAKESLMLFKVWVTLYTCAGTRGIILGAVLHVLIQSHS